MLPTIRNDDHLYSVPKFDIKKSDVKGFLNELKGFHGQFTDCFQRSESRDHFFNYRVTPIWRRPKILLRSLQ